MNITVKTTHPLEASVTGVLRMTTKADEELDDFGAS